MASLTKYAGSISQTTGGKYATFSNLANLKNNVDGSWATTVNIKGKSGSPNRPSTLSFTGFGFGLPTGAEVSKVTITYRHRKTGSCTIGAPTISLLGVSGFSGKGVAPSKTTMTTSTKTFTGSALTRTVVNSSSFGVKVNYPTNSGTGAGTISVSYVRVTVEYKVPSYSLSIKKVSGGYNTKAYVLEASISNSNLTSYNPSLTLTAPTGFNFLSARGRGSCTAVNSRTVVWNPLLDGKTGTSTIQFTFNANVTYPAGTDTYTGTFTLVESLYSGTKNFTASITDRPAGEGSETDPDAPPIIDENNSQTNVKKYNQVKVNEIISIGLPTPPNVSIFFAFPIGSDGNILFTNQDTPICMRETEEYIWQEITDYFDEEEEYFGYSVSQSNFVKHTIKSQTVGRYVIQIFEYTTDVRYYAAGYDVATPLYEYYVEIIPDESELTTPNFSILEVTDEELDRLGDNYTYTAQSYMKHTTTDTFSRDWYKNNRIGVFNNNIENVDDYSTLTDEDIIENALYWSETIAGLNTYESVECEFPYDEDYPLYIILSGDYSETTTYGYDIGTISFTEPSLIEKDVYISREPNGTYPTPINNLLGADDISTLGLDPNQTSTSVVLYDFPLTSGYGTNEDYAIRGLQVRANIESTDDLAVYAKIHAPNGEIGQRSILIDSQDEEIVIGSLGDLWGFTTLQMQNLDEWQLELGASNIILNSEAEILFNNVTIIFYIETVEKQQITVKVQGEDLSYYGAFIESIDIPEGLETDTSFLTIDGTDTNDAYRQNTREKTITIEFNLSNCDIKTSTDMLRQLTKLFVNEKDKYNRPIPKTIEFSHYPTDYFEYIMEEPFDVDADVTDYNVKAKLTIPSGTSYSLEDTVTNTVGNANGLAAINPIIRFRPSDSNIEIRELETGQKFNITYPLDWNSKTIEINCEDRIVHLLQDDGTMVDISKYVDHNTDWFRLSGEFSFEGINCTIISVRFNERW